jgi:DNA-binding NarL/FixJ family response regulator
MERNTARQTWAAPSFTGERPLEDQERTAIWQDLVEGRLRIVATQSLGAQREFIARASLGERLTPREQRVARLVARGLANKQIAFDLHISTSGVGRAIDGALRKLGLESRVDLAVLGAAFDPYARGLDTARPAATCAEQIHGGKRYVHLTASLDEHPSWQVLSSAERDVVGLALAGHANAEIARARGTSSRTIANQLAKVFRKLGISGRTALASQLLIGPESFTSNHWAA